MAIFSVLILHATTTLSSPSSSSSSSSFSSSLSSSPPPPPRRRLLHHHGRDLLFFLQKNKNRIVSTEETKLPRLHSSSSSSSSSSLHYCVKPLLPYLCFRSGSSFHSEDMVLEDSMTDESKAAEEKDIFLPSLCISIFFLQWSFILETRRSFITSFLQHVSRCLVQHFTAQLPLHQIVVGVRPNTFARRVALVMPFLVTASAFCNNKSKAVQAEDLSNPDKSFFQKLGLGDQDIYYPRIFEGSWVCNSTLIAVDTPQGEDKADKKNIEFSRKQLGYTLTYKARFIPFGNKIIGDRLFTTLSLVESTVGKDVVDRGIWTPEQPDRLTLILQGGRKVQNVVTKRSASLTGPGQFETSEYSQQIFDSSRFGGPPTIKASQNRTRYRWDAALGEVSYIEAFQRVSMFPVIEEGLSNFDIMGMDKPIAVYKYIVRFTREANVSSST